MKVLVWALDGIFGVGGKDDGDREVQWRGVGEWGLKIGWVAGYIIW